MYNSGDLERSYFQYQMEAVPMDYLGKFFTGIFNGCRDFWSLAPQNIDLAVRQ